MSNEWAVTTAVAAPVVVGLSHFTLSQTKFLVTGRDRLGGSCEDRIQESVSISSRTRTGQVIYTTQEQRDKWDDRGALTR